MSDQSGDDSGWDLAQCIVLVGTRDEAAVYRVRGGNLISAILAGQAAVPPEELYARPTKEGRLPTPKIFDPGHCWHLLLRKFCSGHVPARAIRSGRQIRRKIEPIHFHSLKIGYSPGALAPYLRSPFIVFNDVRVSREDLMNEFPPATVPADTGAPGRPTAIHFAEAEHQRRVASGEALESVGAESEHLKQWLWIAHPGSPRATAKTIENRIRETHRKAFPQPRPRSPKPPPKSR
jgi:hypothetical protein